MPEISKEPSATLTARERQIVELICRGLGDAEIAKVLDLSPNTIRNHVASLYRKIHVNRRSALVIWAYKSGVAHVDSPTHGAQRHRSNVRPRGKKH